MSGAVVDERFPDRAVPGERPGFRYTSLGSGRAGRCEAGCAAPAVARFPLDVLGIGTTVDLCAECRDGVRERWNR